MTAHVEASITCDGNEGDGPLDCGLRIHARSVVAARAAAKRRGWTVSMRWGKRVDLCRAHSPGGAYAPREMSGGAE